MVYHHWGDETFDWDGLDAAADFIVEGLRWWNVDVNQGKEKFGCLRVYCSLGLHDLQQLTYPGYAFNQWPKWAWKLQYTRPARALTWVLNLLFFPLHKWAFRRYYRLAVVRWPHLREEILQDAHWSEYLEGL